MCVAFDTEIFAGGRGCVGGWETLTVESKKSFLVLFSSENCEQHPDSFTHCPYDEYLDAIGQENSVVTIETFFVNHSFYFQ